MIDENDDICFLCGQPGADKMPHPCHWPGEQGPPQTGDLVHAECEQEECERGFLDFRRQAGEAGVAAFLREIVK